MTKQTNKGTSWLWLLILLILTVVFYYINSQPNTVFPSTESTSTTQAVKGTSTQAPSTKPLVTATIIPSNGTWYEIYFTNPKIPFDGVYEGGIEKYLIAKIDQAKTSIDVTVYQFDLETVAQALISAKNRGVDVRVVYDNDYADLSKIKELDAAGIKTVPDDRSPYMHDKFFVFDDACVWTGSFNITMSAAYRNNENAISFCSTEAAANYDTEFNEMFAGQFGPKSPSDTPYPIFYVDGIKVENYFGSEDHVMDKVVAVVGQAQSSIHFMTYSFTDDQLGQEMLSLADKGVQIEGIFETLGATSQSSECTPLRQKGLDIRLDGNPKTFHHKVIIIDQQIVIFGSFNFTAQANEENDENLLIVYDPSLAASFEQQYQLMKSQAVIPSGTTCKK